MKVIVEIATTEQSVEIIMILLINKNIVMVIVGVILKVGLLNTNVK